MGHQFHSSIDHDWSGRPLSPPLCFKLLSTADELIFQVSRAVPALPHPHSNCGEFQAELWKFDVAEIFFHEPSTGDYLEVNLSPNGGWWACWFDGVRLPRKEQPDFTCIRTKAERTSSTWQATIHLPQAFFTSLDDLRFNMTAILNSPLQTFHSYAPLPGENPDFHQPQEFLPLPWSVPS